MCAFLVNLTGIVLPVDSAMMLLMLEFIMDLPICLSNNSNMWGKKPFCHTKFSWS